MIILIFKEIIIINLNKYNLSKNNKNNINKLVIIINDIVILQKFKAINIKKLPLYNRIIDFV